MLLIRTKRLCLRDPVESDVFGLASYQSDLRYLEHYLESPDSKLIIALAIEWASEKPRKNYQLIVSLKNESEVIGCAGLRTSNCAVGEAEVGIELNPDHWGNGYAAEGLAGIIDLARSKDIRRLLAITKEKNIRAIALTRAAGFHLDKVVEPDLHLSLELAECGDA